VSLTATKRDSNESETKTMDIQAKLTGFAMLGATWVMWVLAGLSVGGWMVALDRAVYLIRTSGKTCTFEVH
jgi:uncharacterized membrane protein YesL